MHDKLILLLASLGAGLAVIVSVALPLPSPLAALLGAALALPVPLMAMRQRKRQQHEQAIRSAQALNAAPQAVLILNAEGNIRCFSQGLQTLAGLPPSQEQASLRTLPVAWQNLIADLYREALQVGWASRQTWLERPQLAAAQIEVSCLKLLAADGETQLQLNWTLIGTRDQPGNSPEALLARSRAFVQTLIDVIPQPVYIKRMEGDIGHYLLVNQAFCAHHLRERETLIGCSALDVFDPVQASIYLQEDRAVAAGSAIFREEQINDSQSGQDRFLIVSKQSCLSPEGDRVIVGTHFDITPWRMAERALQKSLERERNLRERTQSFVQRIIDVIPYPVHVKDAQSRYLMVNDAFVKERGCSREQLLGQSPLHIARLMGAQRAEASETELQRAQLSLQEDLSVLAGKTLIKEEHNYHSVTGEERFRTVFKCSCLDIEAQPAIVTAMFDITQWRIAERDLHATMEREKARSERMRDYLQRIIDVIPQEFYIKDRHSRILMVNRAFLRKRHLHSASEAIGCTLDELAIKMYSNDPAYRDQPEAMAEAIAYYTGRVELSLEEDRETLAGKAVLREEHRTQRLTGEEHVFLIVKEACLDMDEQPVIVCANFDITTLHNAERAQQSEHESPQSK